MSDRIKQNWDKVSFLEMYARELIQRGYDHGLQQKELLDDWNARIATLPKGTPQWVKTQAWSYLLGYWDCFKHEHQAHLYKVEGKFYRCRTQPDDKRVAHFPGWNTLSREQWSDLVKFGGIYWIYPDRDPALFFQSEN